jgi:RimJ/RimL family protein N-acetyltransferase
MENNTFIRKVRSRDLEEVFNLSNQDYVRKYSINKEKIKWEDHVRWFNNTIQERDSVFYVVTDNTKRFLGQIRYKIENGKATVSISLSHLITGKGLSRHLLIESIDKFLSEKKEVTEIVAYVSENNIPSGKLFEKAGFSLCDNQGGLLKYLFQRGVNT